MACPSPVSIRPCAPVVTRVLSMFAACGLSAVLAAASAPLAAAQNFDLTPIFAPPTPAEVQTILNEWQGRTHDVAGYQLEMAYVDPGSGFRYEVVSHLIQGERHYGVIRFPGQYTPGERYPVLVVCHGGVAGAAVEELENLLNVLPGQCVGDDFFMVMPSYRGEQLRSTVAGIFQSEGTQSWADEDVDDASTLLSAVLDNQPDMDRAQVAAWGISRGGSVALLLSARDDRIRRTVDLFGFTDLSLPTVVARVDAIVNHGIAPTGLGRLVNDAVVEPYRNGLTTLAEARLAWLRRSPCFFVDNLPPVQLHHGLQDVQVDPTHTQVMLDALAAAGVPLSEARGFYYPSGMHGVNSLPGHGMEVEPFLCKTNLGPRGYCGPMTPHTGGGFAALDFAGSRSLAQADFRLRVHQCVPNTAGLFFISPTTGFTPSGAGFLCLGAGLQRLGVIFIDGRGFGEFNIDLANMPIAAQSVLTGTGSVYFQFIFRDLGNPAGDWNLTHGLEVGFYP